MWNDKMYKSKQKVEVWVKKNGNNGVQCTDRKAEKWLLGTRRAEA